MNTHNLLLRHVSFVDGLKCEHGKQVSGVHTANLPRRQQPLCLLTARAVALTSKGLKESLYVKIIKRGERGDKDINEIGRTRVLLMMIDGCYICVRAFA